MKHLLTRVSPVHNSNGSSLVELCASGYWLCLSCRGINTREEREQGLPPNCEQCGSIRFKLHPAVMPELITPEDLREM